MGMGRINYPLKASMPNTELLTKIVTQTLIQEDLWEVSEKFRELKIFLQSVEVARVLSIFGIQVRLYVGIFTKPEHLGIQYENNDYYMISPQKDGGYILEFKGYLK